MKLSNRCILVTRGTSGIGHGFVEAFYRSKSRVIVCGRDPEKLLLTEKEFPGVTALRYDVGDARQRENLASDVLRRFPEVDILVNNAGIQRYIDLKNGYSELKTGGDEVAVNFISIVELTALFIDQLMKRPSAAVINVGSGLGFMPMVNMPVYCATKAAVHTYTLVLRQQLRDTPVKVIEVVPPMVDTGLNREGRDGIRLKYRGISVSEYFPTVIKGLEDDEEMIFHGDGNQVMSQPRQESEVRLLGPSW